MKIFCAVAAIFVALLFTTVDMESMRSKFVAVTTTSYVLNLEKTRVG